MNENEKFIQDAIDAVYSEIELKEYFLMVYEMPYFEKKDYKAYFYDLINLSWNNSILYKHRSATKKQIMIKLGIQRLAFNRFYNYCIDNKIISQYKEYSFINPKYMTKGKQKPWLYYLFKK